MTDRFDLPVTAASAAAVADYVAALDLLLSANTGADALLDRAIAADPEFALAHIAQARLLQLQARMGEARAAAARARALAERVSAREQRHIEAVALGIAGAASEALAQIRAHAAEYPRDALPLSLALGVFGLLGFSGRRDHHQAQLALLEELAAHWPEDWWFLGYLGWARIETGAIAAGTPLVERSLALNPRNAHGAHQRVHGYFEAGDAVGGADFVADWLEDYERAGQLHCHLSWHLALFELARGNSERAKAIYVDSIRPSVAQSAPMLSLAEFSILSVALADLSDRPAARHRMGRGCRARPPPFSQGGSRLRRSARRPCRSRGRRRRKSARAHRRAGASGARRAPAAGSGSACAVRRGWRDRPRRQSDGGAGI